MQHVDCRYTKPFDGIAVPSSIPRRDFIEVRRDNPHDSNLTNLNVVHDLDRLYVMHSDWLAHLTRYSYATWLVTNRLKGQARVLDVGSARLEFLQFCYRNRGKIADYVGLDLRATEGWMGHEWLRSPSVPPCTLVRMDVVDDELPVAINMHGGDDPNGSARYVPDGHFTRAENQKWDVVLCFETLEHVPREKAQTLVDRLFNWTKPGGICLLSSPNAGASGSTAENHVGADGQSREHSYKDKTEYAKKAGFEIAGAWGTFCRLDNLPEDLKTTDTFQSAREYLKGGWLNIAFAANHPAQSNNAMFALRKPYLLK